MNATDIFMAAHTIVSVVLVLVFLAAIAYIAYWQLTPRESDPVYDVTDWTADNSVNRRPGRR